MRTHYNFYTRINLNYNKSKIRAQTVVFCCMFYCQVLSESIAQKRDIMTTDPEVHVVGAMQNVMWKGQLGGVISLDTLLPRKGLYGLGPVSYLRGEILINNGQAYRAEVIPDSSMVVEKTFKTSAPFFVYANVEKWREIALPLNVKNIGDLEGFIDRISQGNKRPFAFKLVGTISSGLIHVQNLPPGSQVSSPKEAHQGQVDFNLKKVQVEIIGFFSTEHQGIFTHHDSYLHMHLITKNEGQMGHLDKVEFEKMVLSLPTR